MMYQDGFLSNFYVVLRIMRYEGMTKKQLLVAVKKKRKSQCRPYSKLSKQELINYIRDMDLRQRPGFARMKKTKRARSTKTLSKKAQSKKRRKKRTR